ncbi:hypothetical protein CRI94_01950 [Longibacter salinarum]|uniref:Uncharacterized protein n=1 Tax=Longibacter salinarum TaxID=1850348 RepID=A0A2A8D2G1_9BACT|nr:hypothetical protein [Longibacter salinarum]PEN15074.1 hypothetical protein CRI94_01950 [Longibacter salinarum]
MYIDYIILGILSIAVVLWAYSRLPEENDDDSDGGQSVPVQPSDDDPAPTPGSPPTQSVPSTGDGAHRDVDPQPSPPRRRVKEQPA